MNVNNMPSVAECICALHLDSSHVRILVSNAPHALAPRYLAELINARATARVLRSANKLLLDVPRSGLKTDGGQAVGVAAPKLRNKALDRAG